MSESDEKLAVAKISRKALATLLCLPENVQVDMASYEDKTGAILLRLSGDGLPEDCSTERHADFGHLREVRLWHKATTAVTFDDVPRRVEVIEFDRFI